FVRDSVGRESGDSLEAARVGEHLLWVVEGPRMALACFLTGVPPHGLRGVLSERLERIHAELPPRWDAATAVPDLLPTWDAALDPAGIVADGVELDERQHAPAKTSRWPLLLILLLGLAGLAWYFARIERWDNRVESLRTELRAHPGFLLARLASRPWRHLTVHGLFDADAEPLAPVLARVDFGDVEPRLELEGYVSTADAVVQKRSLRLLDPPGGVRVQVAQGLLDVEGEAPAAWIEANRNRVAWIAGVHDTRWRVRPQQVAQADPAVAAPEPARLRLEQLAQELASVRVEFGDGVEPGPDQLQRIAQMAAIL